MFLPHPRVKVSIVGSLRDREVACSASDRQGSNFESCVWRAVSSQSSHHPQGVLLAQFSLYVHKGGLKPDSFHFISFTSTKCKILKLIKLINGHAFGSTFGILYSLRSPGYLLKQNLSPRHGGGGQTYQCVGQDEIL